MKAITIKEFISLAVIVISATVLALAVFNASAAAAGENSLLLLALTLCGAVVSGLNGFGRRTVKAKAHSHRSRRGPQSNVALTS
jgi:hypothetical protein